MTDDLAYARTMLRLLVTDLDELIAKYPAFKTEGESRKASCQRAEKILELFETFDSQGDFMAVVHAEQAPA